MKDKLKKIYSNPLYRGVVVASWFYAIFATYKGWMPLYTYFTATFVAAGMLGEPYSFVNEFFANSMSHLFYYVYTPAVCVVEYLKAFRRYKSGAK